MNPFTCVLCGAPIPVGDLRPTFLAERCVFLHTYCHRPLYDAQVAYLATVVEEIRAGRAGHGDAAFEHLRFILARYDELGREGA